MRPFFKFVLEPRAIISHRKFGNQKQQCILVFNHTIHTFLQVKTQAARDLVDDLDEECADDETGPLLVNNNQSDDTMIEMQRKR